jgi:hypothetical protein
MGIASRVTPGPVWFQTITPTVDNAVAYTANDIYFDTFAIPDAAYAPDVGFFVASILWLDGDDQAAAATTFYFLDANQSMGTLNSAPNISDANALNIIAQYVMASASAVDVGGAKVYYAGNLWLPVRPAAGTTTLYIAATTAGTPTTATGATKLRLGFAA